MRSPLSLLRALSDETRLRLMSLLHSQGELCVCELTHVLQLSQPKISRHLAILREQKILKDRREGQWIYYRVHPDMPAWGLRTLDALMEGVEDKAPYHADMVRMQQMQGRSLATCASS